MSLLDLEPELARSLRPDERELARARAVAPVQTLACGRWEPAPASPENPDEDPVAFMVIDGLLGRGDRLAGRIGTELIGPGDVFKPGPSTDEELLPHTVEWRVLEPASVLVLGRPLIRAISCWPEVVAALLERLIRQRQRLATHHAICQLPRVEARLLVLFWHLAARWGRVTPDGIAIDLPLRHQTIGELIGARRPSVTVGLGQLRDAGLLARRPDGSFVLRGDPSEDLRIAIDAVATSSRGIRKPKSELEPALG